ncbi:hypothetical protein NQ315_013925 [Exocentrus adspersus]|uniref:MutS-like protein n=1 Tax=Exocentrus adspersus TaxID=1586481 RepID=A0AAV8VSM5_9CUCU|nr:hypothetical protein NQ315_013925 [Exocentrus adspersus]
MNEYDLSEINPMHPDTAGSPTHVIIFCIRFVAGDTFQPIGGLLTYKYKDQSIILAECLKAYINDLWKLGLYVVGTVSPPFECFKGMLSHLVDVGDVNTFSGCLVYSVTPIKEIVHIYDIQFLLIKLQNLFKEGDIKFVELSKEHRASWNDISLVLNLSKEFKILSNYLLDNKDVSRRVHIFTQQIFEQLLEMEAQGVITLSYLSDNPKLCQVLANRQSYPDIGTY